MSNLPGPLVSAAWLQQHLDEVRIVDVRWSIDTGPQIDDYLDAHIPGAVFADLDVDLSAPAGDRGRHPLPSPEHFAATRAVLGIDRPVVAYDNRAGPVAARLWWMLDSIGHPAAVLDGGLEGWAGDLEKGMVTASLDQTPPPVNWPADRFIDAANLLSAINDGAVLLDARSAERFAGEPNPNDSRPGHIPGSVSNPWTDNITEAGQMASPAELRAQLVEHGVGAETDLIASCGSGITGCHNLLAARLAGYQGGRLYVGSWSEWSLDPDRPVARR